MLEAALMQGFPPKSDRQVTLANWRSPPFNRWGFQHVREIVPSADIPNDPGNIWVLPEKAADLSQLSFIHGGQRLDLQAFLSATITDAMVVVHRGALVFAYYSNGMTARTPHILMSVSKSVLGLIAGILVDRGNLDPDRHVVDVIPEVADTAYAGATVGHLLDMRVGVGFEENYTAVSGLIIEYRKSHNWNPLDPGDAPTDMRTFFRRLQKHDGQHGGKLHYVSPNTDLMGWVIERISGQRYADLISDLLWKPLGAAQNAYITVDRLGAPRCAGGICTSAMDLARIGQLIAQNGRRESANIIPSAWIDDIVNHDDVDAWNHGDLAIYFGDARIHYRRNWYVLRDPDPVMFGFGVNGQNLFVDLHNQIVVAKMSSQPIALDQAQIGLTLHGFRAVREHLAGR
jgi:CubicO group peptidase (beta-lactamase class C family)